jgi:hypothetical protein
MITERSSQRPGAGRILGVGLHSDEKRRDCLTGGLFGGGLINSELRGELIHRNVGQDVLYSSHGGAFLLAAKAAPGRYRTALLATLVPIA